MIDNYDSFTYTLVQYFQALGQEVVVKRNDEISITEIAKLQPERIVISPGPCTPSEAGLSVEVIRRFYQSKPIFGVCLGHQSIAQAFGGEVIRAEKVMHGKVSPIYHNSEGLFHTLHNPFKVTRYHSLVVNSDKLPDNLKATAWTRDTDGNNHEIMALESRDYPVVGVQFHPESVLTEHGMKILDNFLKL